jgi:hypothetical protein
MTKRNNRSKLNGMEQKYMKNVALKRVLFKGQNDGRNYGRVAIRATINTG